jgi:DNA repair protein RecO (recombination protein O)
LLIRQRDLGEADRILTLFTRERGKLSAVAKGVKRLRSKLAPVLQLFAQARLQLAAGRSLEVVTQASPEQAFPHLREDVDRYACACYVAELADVMMEEHAAAEWVFELLAATLSALDAGGEMPEEEEGRRSPQGCGPAGPQLGSAALVRGFELKLLSGLGYGPELEACVSCGVEVEKQAGGFSVPEGGVVCRRCARETGTPLSPAALQGMRELVRLPQEELGRRRLTEKTRQELERLMRRFVDYRAERELRSAAFLPGRGGPFRTPRGSFRVPEG